MRTTVDLPDDLIAQVKRVAVGTKRTLSQVIEDSLRESLARRKRRPVERCQLPVFGEGGVRPGVDLDDASALLDVMDDAEPGR